MLALAALLYGLPDMDVVVNFGDPTPCGLPALSSQIDTSRGGPEGCAGFTKPGLHSWEWASCPARTEGVHACLRAAYPPAARDPRAVWRGSPTGHLDVPTTAENFLALPRVRLVLLAQGSPGVLDAQFSEFLQATEAGLAALDQVFPLRPLHFFDYQGLAATIDVDGNTWSDRFFALLNLDAPVLKQRTPFKAFWEGWSRPGEHYVEFANDLSDVVSVAAGVLGDPERAARVARAGRAFKAEALGWRQLVAALRGQLGAVRNATSAPLADLAAAGPGGAVRVPFHCCDVNRNLGDDVAASVARLEREGGAEGGAGAGAGQPS